MKNQNLFLEVNWQREEEDHQFACLSKKKLEKLKNIRFESDFILSLKVKGR